jgi:hypothetical protein
MTPHELPILAVKHGGTVHQFHILTSGTGGAVAFAICVLYLLYVGVTALLRGRG